ncbi:hypothetical protein ARTHRO9AX_220205 [Arthrobacter sp. 9AX]|nr:hypothetical protein ARTHRO9AX_220205 [Arthrobacter sp. 9AX]
MPGAIVVSYSTSSLIPQGVIMDNTASGAFLSFGDPAVGGSIAVVAEYAAVLT